MGIVKKGNDDVKVMRSEREDLDDDTFDLDKYDFNLEEELKAPVKEDDEMKKQTKKKTAKKDAKKTPAAKDTRKTEQSVQNSDNKEALQTTSTEQKPPESTPSAEPKEPLEEEYQPEYYVEPEDEGSGWWVAVLIILILVASGVVYRYSVSQNQVSSEQCTLSFLETLDGEIIDYDTSAQKAQLRTLLLQEPSGAVHQQLQQIACGGSCTAYLVVTEHTVEDTISATVNTCHVDETIVTCGETRVHLDTLELSGNDVYSVSIYDDDIPRSSTYGSGEHSLVIFSTDSGYMSMTVEPGADQSLAARLYAGDRSLEHYHMRYVTENPRIVTWKLR